MVYSILFSDTYSFVRAVQQNGSFIDVDHPQVFPLVLSVLTNRNHPQGFTLLLFHHHHHHLKDSWFQSTNISSKKNESG